MLSSYIVLSLFDVAVPRTVAVAVAIAELGFLSVFAGLYGTLLCHF